MNPVQIDQPNKAEMPTFQIHGYNSLRNLLNRRKTRGQPALAPEAALTYNTASTGFQARSLHGLCQQLLQLYSVPYS